MDEAGNEVRREYSPIDLAEVGGTQGAVKEGSKPPETPPLTPPLLCGSKIGRRPTLPALGGRTCG